MILFNHTVKVIESWSERSLGGNDFFTLEFDNIGVDIIFNIVFVLLSGEYGFCGVKSHDMWVPVVGELFGILVEFLKVVLGLSHKGQDFELGG